MRVRIVALSLLLAFALLLNVRVPGSITQNATATHFGIVECAEIGAPASDGMISPDEYDESFFDEATKILVYFTCENSTERLVHVGIIAPGGGWVGLEIQARDAWDGMLNEIRLSRVASTDTVQADDGLRNFTVGVFESDTVLGGSDDVRNATVGLSGAAEVYEFCTPLRSSDPADSQLQTSGPFYFALEINPVDPDLTSDALVASDLQTLVVESDVSRGAWTQVELSLAPAGPTAESKMLLSLRDELGYPLPGKTLEAFVQTTFGFLDLGTLSTNDQGVAEVAYAPRGSGTYVVGAAYPGGGGLLGSVAWRVLEVTSSGIGEPSSGWLDLGGGVELRPIEAMIVLIVGGVWATYAYALFVTRQTLRPKPRKDVDPTPERHRRGAE